MFLFFPLVSDYLLNTFVKDRIISAVTKADSTYALRLGHLSFDLLANRIACDSIALTTADSVFLFTTGQSSLEGIHWFSIFDDGALNSAHLQVQNAFVILGESGYELRSEHFSVSVPESAITIQTLTITPTGGDERFFAASKFRRDRFLVNIPDASITGIPCLGILKKKYQAEAIHLRDGTIDLLINKNKPSEIETSEPLMPQEALLAIEDTIAVDSINLSNIRFTYRELFSHSSTPALLTWDSIQVVATRISNQTPGDTMFVEARGIFMESGLMKVSMSIPVRTEDASFRYSGSLSGMPLRTLNPFLVIADQIRLKSGTLRWADFRVDVNNGRATGSVRAQYEDLIIAAVDKQTGSEDGLDEQLTTIIANIVEIRGTNLPDESGSMKIGIIRYPVRNDLAFFQIVWFALRNGLGDVIGFSA